MNSSERVAYEWLLDKGYARDDIDFRSNRTPDFLVSDGKAFEVKLLYGKSFRFTAGQVEKILSHGDCSVIVVSRGQVATVVPGEAFRERPDTLEGMRVSYMTNSVTMRVNERTMERLNAFRSYMEHLYWRELSDDERKACFPDGVTTSVAVEYMLASAEERLHTEGIKADGSAGSVNGDRP